MQILHSILFFQTFSDFHYNKIDPEVCVFLLSSLLEYVFAYYVDIIPFLYRNQGNMCGLFPNFPFYP